MYKGIVKWFNNTKGYGFITNEEGNDVFVHFKDINMEGYKTLETGDEVTYDLKTDESNGKVAATNVTVTVSAKSKQSK